MRWHFIDYWLWHFLQLAENDIGSLVIEMLLNALVLKMMWRISTMKLWQWPFIILKLAIGIILLLFLLFVKHDTLFTQILFKIQFKINFLVFKLHFFQLTSLGDVTLFWFSVWTTVAASMCWCCSTGDSMIVLCAKDTSVRCDYWEGKRQKNFA